MTNQPLQAAMVQVSGTKFDQGPRCVTDEPTSRDASGLRLLNTIYQKWHEQQEKGGWNDIKRKVHIVNSFVLTGHGLKEPLQLTFKTKAPWWARYEKTERVSL